MADINQEHLTSGDKLCTSEDGNYNVTGDGVFDDLMEAVNIHLSAQFKLGRIPGDKYADVYLGSLQSTLGAAVQFILGEQRADKEADLLSEQIVTERLKQEQIQAQTDLARAQIKQTQANVDLIKAKICTEKAQACGPGPVDGTVAHAQMELYKKQQESYDRNSENNFLKTVTNAFAANANVAGVPACKVGAFQDPGLDALIRTVGSKMDIPVGGAGACPETTDYDAAAKQLVEQLTGLQTLYAKTPKPTPPDPHSDKSKL